MRVRRHGWMGIGIAIGLALIASIASAGESKVVGGVAIEADTPWPGNANQGYAPLFIRLENRDDTPHQVDLEYDLAWRRQRLQTSKSISLGPRESRNVELLVPTFDRFGRTIHVEVRVDETHQEWLQPAEYRGSRKRQERSALVIAPRPPDPGMTERWTNVLSQSMTHEGEAIPTLVVTAATMDRLPKRPEAYSSLHLVVIDTTHTVPSSEELEPLLSYVRVGGHVAFMGAKALPSSVSPSLEPRMILEQSGSVTTYRFGHGTIIVADSFNLENVGSQREALRRSSLQPTPWLRTHSRPQLRFLPIPGLDDLPLRTFALSLLGFAVLIGPLNLWIIRKRSRPIALLITVPAIASITSLALLGYGLFYQGLDAKSSSHSITVLDQRVQRASTIEARTLYLGSSVGEGLRPGQGTIVTPANYGRQRGKRYEIDQSEGLLLSGDFVSVRKRLRQLCTTDRPSRRRLDVEQVDDGIIVRSAFDEPLNNLMLKTPSGVLYHHLGPINPGDEVLLTLGAPPAEETELAMVEAFEDVVQELLPGTYRARLDQSPFTDPCGVDLNELHAEHAVIGILDLQADSFR